MGRCMRFAYPSFNSRTPKGCDDRELRKEEIEISFNSRTPKGCDSKLRISIR